MKEWSWLTAGLALAASFLLAVVLVTPIGVSTQFVVLDGIVARALNPEWVQADETAKSGFRSPNAYLNKSGGSLAKSIAKPLNYGFVFVLAMGLGGLLSRVSRKDRSAPPLPEIHRTRFGDRRGLRYLISFLGGLIVLWGARLADGCTSGHMMSGMMQTAVSGYLFAAAAFATAVPTAWLLYRRSTGEKS
jgi:hypothetical protein